MSYILSCIIFTSNSHVRFRAGGTLRPGWSQDHPDLGNFLIFFICNNLKFYICLPLKKRFVTTLSLFYAQ